MDFICSGMNSRLPHATGVVGKFAGRAVGIEQHGFDFVAVERDGANPGGFIARAFEQTS